MIRAWVASRIAPWFSGACLVLVGLTILLGDRVLTRGVTYGPPPRLVALPSAGVAPPAPANGLGINVEFDKIVKERDLRRSIALIKAGGFTYLRQVFAWNEIEISAKGDFYDHKNHKSAWEKYDHFVNEANAAGLQFIARLERPPNWSRTDNRYQTAPPDHFRDYAAFVYAFVKHFKGRIHYIQIWNEPNRYEDWGHQPVDPVAYTRLLRAGYLAAKRADPTITVLSAALTPTTDCCLNNRPDPVFLQEMYNAGAAKYFDVLGAQAYGLRTGPEDPWADLPLHPNAARKAIIDSHNTNFGRVFLDRQVMVRNGDAAKPVWVGEFGWNSLPPNWQGDASPWGSVSRSQQAAYTVAAYQRARREWPWMGPMCLWFFQDPSPAPRDPTQFFSVVNQHFQPRPVYTAIQNLARQPAVADTGNHGAGSAAASYRGLWQPAAGSSHGKISPISGASAQLIFRGNGVSLRTQRGPGMGIAYASVDGSPTYATEVPKDSAGRAAVDLYAPSPAVATISESTPIASGLPYGRHVLTVTVSGRKNARSAGAGVQVDGYQVVLTRDPRPAYAGGGALGVGLLVLLWNAFAALSGALCRKAPGVARRISAVVSGEDRARARLGTPQWSVAFAAALALFYFAPPLPLALLGAAAFLLLAMARPDVGLSFVPLVTPFYLQPRRLGHEAVPLSEAVIALCLVAYLARTAWLGQWRWPRTRFGWPALLFAAAAGASVVAAAYPRYSLRELRTDVIEPLVFFGLILRVRPRVRVLIDSLLAGGTIVALVGLALYARGTGIEAGGVRRMV
ncbi:MAG: glycoside hydrolase 5 family protein, partial [Chloroflexota bacterium]